MIRSAEVVPLPTETPVNDFTCGAAWPDFALNAGLPRHRWYRFKEGFSAGLVKSFVGEHMPADYRGRLLDPFLGSGTTAVEGARLGHDVHGIETNPFMAFLAKVKTRNYSGVKNLARGFEPDACFYGRNLHRVQGKTLFGSATIRRSSSTRIT